jgi:hypothetical protein
MQSVHEKARDTLTKKGVLLDELIMLDDSFDDGAYEYLLIFPDRVEYINTGKVGTLTKKGKGTEVIPISRISSVQTRKKVIFEMIDITTSGNVIEFKSSPWVAPKIKETILELVNKASSAAGNVAQTIDPTEQLTKLAELHKAGVLTDEEFNVKKTELLGRI